MAVDDGWWPAQHRFTRTWKRERDLDEAYRRRHHGTHRDEELRAGDIFWVRVAINDGAASA